MVPESQREWEAMGTVSEGKEEGAIYSLKMGLAGWQVAAAWVPGRYSVHVRAISTRSDGCVNCWLDERMPRRTGYASP